MAPRVWLSHLRLPLKQQPKKQAHWVHPGLALTDTLSWQVS